jgi:hypothetical protein
VGSAGGSDATYNVVLVLKVGVVFLHGGVDGLEGRDEVVEDGGTPCFPLWLAEAACVDDAHLLEHRRLAALTSTCRLELATWRQARFSRRHTEQQQLHLALGPLPVHAQHLLDVLILLELGIGGFPSKTHGSRCHSQ